MAEQPDTMPVGGGPRFLSRKIRARDAIEGTGVMPRAVILSCTLIGPKPRPEDSNAARTLTRLVFHGLADLGRLDRGRRVCGSSAVARLSVTAWERIT